METILNNQTLNQSIGDEKPKVEYTQVCLYPRNFTGANKAAYDRTTSSRAEPRDDTTISVISRPEWIIQDVSQLPMSR